MILIYSNKNQPPSSILCCDAAIVKVSTIISALINMFTPPPHPPVIL